MVQFFWPTLYILSDQLYNNDSDPSRFTVLIATHVCQTQNSAWKRSWSVQIADARYLRGSWASYFT